MLFELLVKSEDDVFLLATSIFEGAITGDGISLTIDEEGNSVGIFCRGLFCRPSFC